MFRKFYENAEFQKISDLMICYDGSLGVINQIRQLIFRNPNCLQQCNLNNENLLHLAVKTGKYEIFNEIIKALGSQITSAARKLTNKGLLAIHYLPSSLARSQDEILMYQKLEEVILNTSFKPIQEPISFKEIIEDNLSNIQENESLLFRLHYAWIAAMYARSCISSSLFHMSANLLNNVDLQKLHERGSNFLQDLQNRYEASKLQFADADQEKFWRLITTTQCSIDHNYGNCIEYGALVLDAFTTMGLHAYPELFFISQNNFQPGEENPSDHVFVILFNKKRTDHFENWGEEIFIDAFSGKIFLGSQLLHNLYDSKGIESFDGKREYNLDCPFDPLIHTIKRLPDFNFSESFWKNLPPPDFSRFVNLTGINENVIYIEHIRQFLEEQKTKPSR